jgi:hypothetical protein
MILRTVVFAVAGYVALASAALAGEVNLAAADGAVLYVDWQGCRHAFATIACSRISPAGPIAPIIAASTVNFITARRRRSAVAVSATAIATGTAYCAVTPDLAAS